MEGNLPWKQHRRRVALRAALVLLAALFLVNKSRLERRPEGTVAVYIRQGWNLLSLPAASPMGVSPPSFPKPGRWPSRSREGAGPWTRCTRSRFWLKFAQSDTIFHYWEIVHSLTIPVRLEPGRLHSAPVSVGSVTSNASGISPSGSATSPDRAPVPQRSPTGARERVLGEDIQSGIDHPYKQDESTLSGCSDSLVGRGDLCHGTCWGPVWLKENLDYGIRLTAWRHKGTTARSRNTYNDDPLVRIIRRPLPVGRGDAVSDDPWKSVRVLPPPAGDPDVDGVRV